MPVTIARNATQVSLYTKVVAHLVLDYVLSAAVPLHAQNADQTTHTLIPQKNANASMGINLII